MKGLNESSRYKFKILYLHYHNAYIIAWLLEAFGSRDKTVFVCSVILQENLIKSLHDFMVWSSIR